LAGLKFEEEEKLLLNMNMDSESVDRQGQRGAASGILFIGAWFNMQDLEIGTRLTRGN
jgi:hypothetical protein